MGRRRRRRFNTFNVGRVHVLKETPCPMEMKVLFSVSHVAESQGRTRVSVEPQLKHSTKHRAIF